jgi:uncharacterized membrane protein (GlpM family)
MTHYLIPLAGEIAVIYNRIYTQGGSFQHCVRSYILSVLFCLVMGLIYLRSLFITSMFFHTNRECAMAVLISVLIGVVPMWLMDGSAYWNTCLACPKPARLKA